MSAWGKNVANLRALMESLAVTGRDGRPLDADAAFLTWRDITQEIKTGGRTIYIIGNGASASMASHISADLEKNFFVSTEVFTDLSLITAIGNDLGYENVFSEPLRRKMVAGDALVAISSSGGSPNVVKAAALARDTGGTVVTLSAMKPDNPLRGLGDLNFHVPAKTYGMAETCHAAILHYWVDIMTETMEKE